MLCCVGLFGGLAVGQALGGPWTVVAPAAGFGLGFLADMKLMKGMHGRGHPQQEPTARGGSDAAAPPAADAGRAGAMPAASSGQGPNELLHGPAAP